jgi:hypothetical protein
VVSEDVVFVYLTDSTKDPGDLVTEIQLRVDPSALSMSDRLQTSDCPGMGVKTVPDYMAAQITKPLRVSNPAALYRQAYATIARQGMRPTGPPAEMFPSAEKISDDASYEEIRSVIMVPAGR